MGRVAIAEDASKLVGADVFDFAPGGGPYGPAKPAPRSTERIVFRPQVIVDDVDGEEVVDANTGGHRVAVVAVDVGFRHARQFLEHLALDQHETAAADLDLEGIVGGNRAVSGQVHDVEKAGVAVEAVVGDAIGNGLPDARPVDALHRAGRHDDRLIGGHHAGHVLHADTRISVDEQQVRRIGLEEVVGDGVARPLDQALVGQKDGRQLVAFGLERQRERCDGPVERQHAGAAIHRRAESDMQTFLGLQVSGS